MSIHQIRFWSSAYRLPPGTVPYGLKVTEKGFLSNRTNGQTNGVFLQKVIGEEGMNNMTFTNHYVRFDNACCEIFQTTTRRGWEEGNTTIFISVSFVVSGFFSHLAHIHVMSLARLKSSLEPVEGVIFAMNVERNWPAK
jgi:hypothetical protein